MASHCTPPTVCRPWLHSLLHMDCSLPIVSDPLLAGLSSAMAGVMCTVLLSANSRHAGCHLLSAMHDVLLRCQIWWHASYYVRSATCRQAGVTDNRSYPHTYALQLSPRPLTGTKSIVFAEKLVPLYESSVSVPQFHPTPPRLGARITKPRPLCLVTTGIFEDAADERADMSGTRT